MKKFDYMDAVGGALFCVLGLAISFYSWSTYELGSLDEMGPGLFPLYLGVIMCLLGLGIVGTALGRSPQVRTINLRPMFAVVLSVLAFAFAIERFGAVVAIVALVFISAWPESKLTLRRKAILAAALVLIAFVVFKFGLSMNFSLVKGI